MKDYLKLIVGILALGFLIYSVQKDFGEKKTKVENKAQAALFEIQPATSNL